MTDTKVQRAEPIRETIGVATTARGRLYRGQTSLDFYGRRRVGLILSAVLLVITILSLFTRELNLGIDFEGGVVWDVPGSSFTIEDAEGILRDNDIDPSEAQIQERGSDSGDLIKIQVADQPADVSERLRTAFAESAGVDIDEVSLNSVSSTWGREITEKAVRALVVFLLVVAVFISIRFEWRVALASIIAMLHDVAVSVGIYSLFGFVVTPETVIAFLTILGFSLYDSIVVFDRVRENEARYAAHKSPYADVINVSMNQVLMRSLNTSISSVIPVLSLLIIGAGILGADALNEFAIALLVGMVTGAYSSIFIAVPLLAIFKQRDPKWPTSGTERALGERLRDLVVGGSPGVAKRIRTAETGRVTGTPTAAGTTEAASSANRPERLLTHPPRPRKKKRR
ncbi:MAG TPA: protein translocase subunit SecF [Ilumatobacteraceae bacterium]|nr:protein translocase subunit SecF [Ilumatobacteraceae bacterium]